MARRTTRIPGDRSDGEGSDPDGEGSDLDGEPAATDRAAGRTVRGRRTRQSLVDAARTVFERDGFLHARIADICDAAPISHGSFYTYFSSKEQIFREVVDSVELDLLRVEPSPLPDPIERLRSANHRYLEHYRDYAGILRVIQQVATFDPEVAATRLQRQNEFAHAVERRTIEYQKQGLADPRIDPWIAANALAGMVAFLADQLFVQARRYGFDETVDQLTLLWANAIGLRRPPGS